MRHEFRAIPLHPMQRAPAHIAPASTLNIKIAFNSATRFVLIRSQTGILKAVSQISSEERSCPTL